MTNAAEQCELGLEKLLYRDYEEAIKYFEKAQELDPNSAEIAFNLGQCYVGLGEYHGALIHYTKATCLKSDYSEAYALMGSCFYNVLDIDSAIYCYKRAVDVAKTDKFRTDCLNDVSAMYFAIGDYEEGYRYFQYRNVKDNWNLTESLEGKTLYVMGDGGLGDQIFFSRYLDMVSKLGFEKLIIKVSSAIKPWLEVTMSEPWRCITITDEEPESYDYLVSLSSLPKVFNTQIGTVPIIRHTMADLSEIKNIGIAWSGNPLHANDAQRSMSAAQINKLIDALPDKTFFKFQKHVLYADKNDIHPRLIDVEYPDVFQMAYKMAEYEIDLIITVDTMTAHLACTEGYPTFIMLPYAPDWRWGLCGDTTVWYPTARLFRQEADRNWDVVINNVVTAIRGMEDGRNSR